MERIGIVGVGRMGANMARRLHQVGYKITAVYDAHPPSAEAIAEELGSVVCRKLSEVTSSADVIFTVVTDDKAQITLFTHKKDNLLINATGKIFINCATVSPKIHIQIAQLAKKAKSESLEACMASSINQALSGTLYLMCAGEKATFDHAVPILAKLSDEGKLLRYIGTSGKAAQVKALVNMVMNINTAGLAEGLGLGAALKLDLKVLMEIFSQTGAHSRVLQTDGEDMLNRDHLCFFSAAHAAKDSGIALELAKTVKQDFPLARATCKQYKKMVQRGFGDLDKSGIAELTFPGRGQKVKPKNGS